MAILGITTCETQLAQTSYPTTGYNKFFAGGVAKSFSAITTGQGLPGAFDRVEMT